MAALSKDQVRAFFERGFLVQPGVFSAQEVETMRAAFSRLEAMARLLSTTRAYRGSWFVLEQAAAPGPTDGLRIHRIVWCGAAQPILSHYGRDPRLLEMAAQILGSREMDHLINQAHFKLPGDGVAFGWHQDSRHRRFGQGPWKDVNGRGSYVQTVVALDDVTPNSGPLRLIPGSCKLGHLPRFPDQWPASELADPARAVAPSLASGSVLLFGPYTLHSSLPNQSARPRRAFINGYAFPGANTRVYPGRGAGRRLRSPGASRPCGRRGRGVQQ